MAATSAFNLSLRMGSAWLFASALVLISGPCIIEPALPLLQTAVDLLQADFTVVLELKQSSGGWLISTQPFLMRSVALAAGSSIAPFTHLGRFSINVDHTLVPQVIFLTVAWSWPCARRRELVARLALTLPALSILLALDVPAHLVGLVEIYLAEVGRVNASSRAAWPITWMIFMESGGRWLLAILVAAVCVGVSRLKRAEDARQAPLPRTSLSPRAALAFPPV
jgi:hypothetical protein